MQGIKGVALLHKELGFIPSATRTLHASSTYEASHHGKKISSSAIAYPVLPAAGSTLKP